MLSILLTELVRLSADIFDRYLELLFEFDFKYLHIILKLDLLCFLILVLNLIFCISNIKIGEEKKREKKEEKNFNENNLLLGSFVFELFLKFNWRKFNSIFSKFSVKAREIERVEIVGWWLCTHSAYSTVTRIHSKFMRCITFMANHSAFSKK